MMSIRAVVAEGVGTFVLVFMGSLALVSSSILTGGQGVDPVVSQLFVPFAFGLGLMAAIAIGGHVSGGHFNPAVTLGALFDGRLTWVSAIGYAVAQVLGALAASLAILLLSSSAIVAATRTTAGATAPGVFAQELRAFSAEVVLTALFVAVILTVTRKQPDLAVIVIPIVLVAIHFAAIPVSGASVNPARSLAPAVVSGNYAGLWVYLTAPFAGSVIGWAIYRFLTPPDDELSVEDDDDYLDDDELDEIAETLGEDDEEGTTR
jgi:aquaporin Z